MGLMLNRGKAAESPAGKTLRYLLNIDANHVAPGFSPAPNVCGNRIRQGWRSDEPGGAGLKLGATTKNPFGVNIIGRGYPPPNRMSRWCTQRMKIDPVNTLAKQRVGIRFSGDLRAPTGGRTRRYKPAPAAPKAPPAPKPWQPAQPATDCGAT